MNRYAILLFASLISLAVDAQKNTASPAPVYPVPSAKQLQWHNMEMNAFVHFSINTFTDKEWGYGDESSSLFAPDSLDAGQWARVLKQAGFKGIILTAKHHDGFCLWPTRYTDHSVKNSPWKNGKGDVVRELSSACKKENVKFGIYLSPWDRHQASYGTPAYIQYYRNQLKELFNNYGPVFEMWFDGANGGDGYYGGAKEKRQINGATYYDWPNTLKMVRAIQPQVVFFSDAGPDIRWCGNERGVAGETNWNTITADTLYAGKPGIEALLNTGSEGGKNWIPQEVDVSIRPGWFYHSKEDSQVKSPEELFKIYLSSVGRGANLLLNVPPDQHGRIHEEDVRALQGFRELLDKTFRHNLAKDANIHASSVRGNSKLFAAAMLNDGNQQTYWCTDDEVKSGEIEIVFKKPVPVKYISLQEYLRLGQRVKSFGIDGWKDGQWVEIAGGTTIGHKRILSTDPVTTSKIRIRILSSIACPVISEVGVY